MLNDVRRIFHEEFKFHLFRFYRVFFLRCIATLEFHQFHFLREKTSSTGFDEPSSTVNWRQRESAQHFVIGDLRVHRNRIRTRRTFDLRPKIPGLRLEHACSVCAAPRVPCPWHYIKIASTSNPLAIGWLAFFCLLRYYVGLSNHDMYLNILIHWWSKLNSCDRNKYADKNTYCYEIGSLLVWHDSLSAISLYNVLCNFVRYIIFSGYSCSSYEDDQCFYPIHRPYQQTAMVFLILCRNTRRVWRFAL